MLPAAWAGRKPVAVGASGAMYCPACSLRARTGAKLWGIGRVQRKLWSCVLIVGLATPVAAQTLPAQAAIPAEQALSANGVTARCMVRTTSKHDGQDWDFVVPVPSDKQADFKTKGFHPAACGKMLSQLADHKRFMCELAKGNDAVQQQTEAQLGMDARKLCAAAKLLLPDTGVEQPAS